MIDVGLLFAVSLLLCVVVTPSCLASLATVQQTVLVSRGGRVDLRPALTFNLTYIAALDAHCRVTNVAVGNGSSCGQILPSIFDCTAYSGPITYQHFGCFADKELATFMVSAVRGSNSLLQPPSSQAKSVHIDTHSIEVMVGPPHDLLAALKVEATPCNESVNLTVVFPPAMVGHCYYEVLSAWPTLPLPIAGTLEGAVKQLLPSGYVQNSPLAYQPHTSFSGTMQSYTDYVLIKIYSHRSIQTSYAILPFRVGQLADDSEDRVLELGRDTLVVIHQVFNTPVNFSLGPSTQLLRYTFPVLNNGLFRSLHSADGGVSFSTFTNQELVAGLVAFYPSYSRRYSFTSYSYNVTNIAGVLVARGVVGLLSHNLDPHRPSQRRNLPLAVEEGGVATINETTIDFYFYGYCSHATLQAVRPPAHGRLVYSNGSNVGNDSIQLLLVLNSSLLKYRHNGGEELGDVISWEVHCPSQRSLQVFMSVLVAAVDDTRPTFMNIHSYLKAYRGWGLPISPSSLQAADVDSAHIDIHFYVHSMVGTLLKASRHAQSLEGSSTLFPLVAFNTLVPIIGKGFNEVRNFSLRDLEQQRIWYLPGAARLEQVLLTVGDSVNGEAPLIHNLFIDVSPLAPNHTLLISTATQYPYVLENKPLPLSNEGHMFLTPYFLYSRAPPSPPRDMHYVIQTPPQRGQLCLARSACVESVPVFSQQDVNYHRLVYRPDRRHGTLLLPDNFTFLATVHGVAHRHPLLHTFNWTVSTQTTVATEGEFWVGTGREDAITSMFLHPFSSLLGSVNLTFHMYEQPLFGDLTIRNGTLVEAVRPSHFTWGDVLDRRLWYAHSQHRGPEVCSDELLFDAVSPLGNTTGHLPILLRRGDTELSVDVTSHFLEGLNHFTFSGEDVNVSSSFCLQFVRFSVSRPPRLGTLRLKDYTYNTQRELLEGSNFTAKDILVGALSYSLAGTEVGALNASITDEFSMNVSDPSSLQPQEEYFTIFITPSPEAMLQVNFSTRHPVTWLPSYQAYGYVLTAQDIQLLNTSLQPEEVVVQTEKELSLGTLEKRGTIISFFTAADLQEGSVVYLKNSHQLEVFVERIKFGVYAYLPSFSRRAGLNQFLVEWAIVELEESRVTISELQGSLHLSIRYVLSSMCNVSIKLPSHIMLSHGPGNWVIWSKLPIQLWQHH
jgi:hypothetical protein